MLLFAAVAAMVALTFLLASLLVVANRKLYVREDPRIDIVEEMLPHANCGACGLPGCRAFAEALVKKESLPVQCTVGSAEDQQNIAKFLGVDVGVQEKQVARLACAGGTNVSRNRANYTGLKSCRAEAQVSGGSKSCSWGCLGLGDCETACDFEAIRLNAHRLPVVNETLCTACGDCVAVCPKDLFSLQPVSRRLWVACKNQEAGDAILAECEVACTACGRCAMDAPAGLIAMKRNLPAIDYTKKHSTTLPIQRCPTGAIVWINADGTVAKGRESKKIIRDEALREAAS